MGLFDMFLGAPSKPVSVDEAMQSLEDEDVDLLHEPAEYYVKPLSLESDADVAVVENEIRLKNVVLLNIAPLARNAPRLKESLSKLSAAAMSVNGDIARISEDKILVTPQGMKIMRSAKKHPR